VGGLDGQGRKRVGQTKTLAICFERRFVGCRFFFYLAHVSANQQSFEGRWERTMDFFMRNYGVSTYDELLSNTIHGRQPQSVPVAVLAQGAQMHIPSAPGLPRRKREVGGGNTQAHLRWSMSKQYALYLHHCLPKPGKYCNPTP
jgi:hypothetical protein